MSLKTEKDKLQVQYRLHLNRIKTEYNLSDKELGLLMGLSDPQGDLVRQMRSAKAQVQTCRINTLCQNMITEYQDSSLLQELVPEGFTAVVYQVTEDKINLSQSINEIVVFVGKLSEQLQTNDDCSYEDMGKSAVKIAELALSINANYQKHGGHK